MPAADAHAQNPQYLVAGDQSAARELQGDSELGAHLRKCTALLSPRLRRTFQLRVVDSFSILETAQVLGVPQGRLKAQLARAREYVPYSQRGGVHNDLVRGIFLNPEANVRMQEEARKWRANCQGNKL
jgi:hypothetical protein